MKIKCTDEILILSGLATSVHKYGASIHTCLFMF